MRETEQYETSMVWVCVSQEKGKSMVKKNLHPKEFPGGRIAELGTKQEKGVT